MSSLIGSSLPELLKIEKAKYLKDAAERGGTAGGFRDWIRNEYVAEPEKFNALVPQALMEAATRTWQAQPRKHGPDLFSFAGGFWALESYTRPSSRYVGEDGIENDDEERFEKVSCWFATVDDAYEDATIKMHKAEQATAAAEDRMKAADAARAKAHGNRKTFLRDLAD